MKIKQPCKNPCKTCPYKKDSVPGYFAGHEPEIYRGAISQDTIIACHSNSKHDESGMATTAVVCTGHIVAQIKSCKRPNALHREASDAHKLIRSLDILDELKDNNLSIFDFNQHHGV